MIDFIVWLILIALLCGGVFLSYVFVLAFNIKETLKVLETWQEGDIIYLSGFNANAVYLAHYLNRGKVVIRLQGNRPFGGSYEYFISVRSVERYINQSLLEREKK